LCKDLNEEAALRNEEAISLHHELDHVRAERDETATQVEKLQAQVTLFEREREEQAKAQRALQKYEQKGLDGADRAIQKRDTIITDLASRLERALDTLDLEREQQRQRRKIIFPMARVSAAADRKNGEELATELRHTKEALRDSQVAMEALKNITQKKEVACMVRNETLERQLDAARSD
jgi:hypothetical protein